MLSLGFYALRLGWEGRGPCARRGGPRHGPKQWKDRSARARVERRLSQYKSGGSAGVPAGTYAAKHPNMAVPEQLRAMADAYDAIYNIGGGGEGEAAPAPAPAPAQPQPPRDLAAGAEEWGMGTSGRRLGGGGAGPGAHAKSSFAPMASTRGFVVKGNPAAAAAAAAGQGGGEG